MSHHHAPKQACEEPTLKCASKVTPTFAPDGSLWLAWAAAGRVSVARSIDLGRTFSSRTALNADPLELDWGPDACPKIAVDAQGRVFVAFAVFKDKNFNGQVLLTRSTDGGKSFAPLAPITADRESQRFKSIALDLDGSLFAAWLDKRNRAPAKARNQSYAGAALAVAWSNDHGATVSDTRIAQDNTCECCRLGIAFAGAGRPVVAFRNIFDGTVRDHAVTTFVDPQTPGPVYRVSVDDWKTDVCPHHGPSIAVSEDGAYHVSWFTNGLVRKGLFYARSLDGGRTFSDPMPVGRFDRNPSHPSLIAAGDTLWLVWKEFDGEKTTVPAMISRDNGSSWSTPIVAAETAARVGSSTLGNEWNARISVLADAKRQLSGYPAGGRAMKKCLLLALLVLSLPFGSIGSAALDEINPFVRGSWKHVLNAHAGQPVVVHFWGVTCGPCSGRNAALGRASAGEAQPQSGRNQRRPGSE